MGPGTAPLLQRWPAETSANFPPLGPAPTGACGRLACSPQAAEPLVSAVSKQGQDLAKKFALDLARAGLAIVSCSCARFR
jgi:hypothetical protein